MNEQFTGFVCQLHWSAAALFSSRRDNGRQANVVGMLCPQCLLNEQALKAQAKAKDATEKAAPGLSILNHE